jgi:hypothetical protein
MQFRGNGLLPHSLQSMSSWVADGTAVQVVAAEDIAQPRNRADVRSRDRKMDLEAEGDDRAETAGGDGCLKLVLSDGTTLLPVLEMERLGLCVGSKTVLRGRVEVRHGMALLYKHNLP